MPRAILSEHQAEVEAATAPAEVAGGSHDEEENGPDECQDESWWNECKQQWWEARPSICCSSSSTHEQWVYHEPYEQLRQARRQWSA